MDTDSSYLPVHNEKGDRDKTAFISHHGLYQLSLMPFRLSNAPGIFLQTMIVILSPEKWEITLAHLGDVIIFSRIANEHIESVHTLMSLLHKAGVTLKLKR